MRTKIVISLCSFPSNLLRFVVRKYRRSEGRVLLHSCDFRYILALFEESGLQRPYRKDLGETPSRRLVYLERWLWSAKPTDRATSWRLRSVLVKSSFARSTRLRTTYWCGEKPVERLNSLEKW